MLSKDKKEWFDLPTIEKHDNDFKDKKFDKKMALGLLNEVQVHWCGDCDNYKHSGCGCYFPSFKKEMIKKIDKHFEVLDVIKEEVDDIQTVIDLLDVLAMGHIDIAIKKLEIIQDKLCPDCMLYKGVEEKYVIASTLFKGNFALGRIVDCNHIYKAIEESGKNFLSPRESFKIFVAKGWLDYDE